MAATNRQQGLPLPENFINQQYFTKIPFSSVRRDLDGSADFARQLLSVQAGFDIIPSGEHDSITPADAGGDGVA